MSHTSLMGEKSDNMVDEWTVIWELRKEKGLVFFKMVDQCLARELSFKQCHVFGWIQLCVSARKFSKFSTYVSNKLSGVESGNLTDQGWIVTSESQREF